MEKTLLDGIKDDCFDRFSLPKEVQCPACSTRASYSLMAITAVALVVFGSLGRTELLPLPTDLANFMIIVGSAALPAVIILYVITRIPQKWRSFSSSF